MRFQCLEVTCGKSFGWTAKKIVQAISEEHELPITYEYVVCPYCGSLDFEEYTAKPIPKLKTIPPVEYPKAVTQKAQFDPADLMQHNWKKGKRKPDGTYDVGSLAYGWDFANTFKPETTRELQIQGTLEIGGYEFSIDQSMKFVRAKKAST